MLFLCQAFLLSLIKAAADCNESGNGPREVVIMMQRYIYHRGRQELGKQTQKVDCSHTDPQLMVSVRLRL